MIESLGVPGTNTKTSVYALPYNPNEVDYRILVYFPDKIPDFNQPSNQLSLAAVSIKDINSWQNGETLAQAGKVAELIILKNNTAALHLDQEIKYTANLNCAINVTIYDFEVPDRLIKLPISTNLYNLNIRPMSQSEENEVSKYFDSFINHCEKQDLKRLADRQINAKKIDKNDAKPCNIL